MDRQIGVNGRAVPKFRFRIEINFDFFQFRFRRWISKKSKLFYTRYFEYFAIDYGKIKQKKRKKAINIIYFNCQIILGLMHLLIHTIFFQTLWFRKFRFRISTFFNFGTALIGTHLGRPSSGDCIPAMVSPPFAVSLAATVAGRFLCRRSITRYPHTPNPQTRKLLWVCVCWHLTMIGQNMYGVLLSKMVREECTWPILWFSSEVRKEK